MGISLIAIGKRMPQWVEIGFQEYARRLPPDFKLQLVEIPMLKRTGDIQRAIRQEGEQMLAAIAKDSHVIALDVKGKQWDTLQLAKQLQKWHDLGQPVSLLIGGPEGLAETCLTRSNQKWSLSALTFPHPLVRIIVAEQLYRAWSILAHHPYHRN